MWHNVGHSKTLQLHAINTELFVTFELLDLYDLFKADSFFLFILAAVPHVMLI